MRVVRSHGELGAPFPTLTPTFSRQRERESSGELVEQLVLILLNGLVYGMLLFMLSSGLTLIFGMLGVLNLAQASFYMLGAYFAYTIGGASASGPPWCIAPAIVGVLGALVERYGLRAVHKHGHLAELLFTFGLAYIIGEIVPLIWGRSPVPYRVPAALDFPLFQIGANAYPAYRLFMMGVGLSMFIALFATLARTRLGWWCGRRSRIPRWSRCSATTCRACSRWCSGRDARWPGWRG